MIDSYFYGIEGDKNMAATQVVTRTEQEIAYIQDDPRKPGYINIGQVERWLSTIGGGALLVYGLRRLDLKGLLLGLAGGGLLWRGITGRSYLYKALDISTVEKSPSTRKSLPGKGVRVCKSMTIERPTQELYRFWRDVEKAPLYILNLESVTATDNTHSHWVARMPGGKTIAWDAEITQEQPDSLIAWRIKGKSPLGNQGRVRFEPAGNQRGTVVTLRCSASDWIRIAGGRLPLPRALFTRRLCISGNWLIAAQLPKIFPS